MRFDIYLYQNGFAKSRQKAQELISAGAVTLDGIVVTKSSYAIEEGVPHDVRVTETCPFVSRGGLKLEDALNTFHISVKGTTAIDVGASTGGFTDCLLKRGAAKVYAVDAGFAQLDPALKADPRVVSIERFNARDLNSDVIDTLCDFAVMDVSFISQTLILPALSGVLKSGAQFVSLIKPQFEAGRSAIEKNGIVKNPAYRFLAVKRVLHAAEALGFFCLGIKRSPIKGGDGNTEYLAVFRKDDVPVLSSPITDMQIKRITKES